MFAVAWFFHWHITNLKEEGVSLLVMFLGWGSFFSRKHLVLVKISYVIGQIIANICFWINPCRGSSLIWLTNLPESPNHYHSKGRITIIIFVCFCFFFRAHPWHMEVPKLGVELELHLLGYTTATATWDPSSICNLHFSSQQHWVFNPLIQDRDWTCILMDASPVHLRWATKGTPYFLFFLFWPFGSIWSSLARDQIRAAVVT